MNQRNNYIAQQSSATRDDPLSPALALERLAYFSETDRKRLQSSILTSCAG